MKNKNRTDNHKDYWNNYNKITNNNVNIIVDLTQLPLPYPIPILLFVDENEWNI